MEKAQEDLYSALIPKLRIPESERLQLVSNALTQGANCNFQYKDDLNNTSLHLAVKFGYKEIYYFLISKGARKDIKNNKNQTVYDLLLLYQSNKRKTNQSNYEFSKKELGDYTKEKSDAFKRGKEAEKYEDAVFCLLVSKGLKKFQNNYFEVGREIKTSETNKEANDDTLFSYQENGKKFIIPIQVKHKSKNYQITSHDLMNWPTPESHFSVSKYFLSYLGLSRKIKEMTNGEPSSIGLDHRDFFKDSEIQYLVIFTSAFVDGRSLKEGGFELKDAPKDVADIFSWSTEITESNYLQLAGINDTLKDRLLKTFSNFEKQLKLQNQVEASLSEAGRQQVIADFLNKLVFVVNQPKAEDLEMIITTQMFSDTLKITPFQSVQCHKLFQQYKEKLEKSFPEKKGGRPTGWILGNDAHKFSQEQAKRIGTITIVTCMTVMYYEKTTNCGKFKNVSESKEFSDFLLSSRCRVLNISTSETFLSSIKLLQRLSSIKEFSVEECGRISVDLKELLGSDHCMEAVVEAFKVSKANLLTIECGGDLQNQESNLDSLFEQLINIMQKNARKKIVLVTQKNQHNHLGGRFEANLKARGQYLVLEDAITLKDFKPCHNPLESKSLLFLGQERTSIAEMTSITNWHDFLNALFFLGDFDEAAQARTLVELISSTKTFQIGSKPIQISDLEGAYSDSLEEINIETLKKSIVNNLSADRKVIYVISGIDTRNEDDAKKFLTHALQLEADDTKEKIKGDVNILSNRSSMPMGIKTVQLANGDFDEESFKEFCHYHADKRVYWIRWDKINFVLQKIFNYDFYIDRDFNEVVFNLEIRTLIVPQPSEFQEVKEAEMGEEEDEMEVDEGVEGEMEAEEQQKEKEEKGNFVFTGIRDKNALAHLLGIKISNLESENRVFVVSNEDEGKERFSNLRNPAHWLQIKSYGKNKKIVWRNSKGCVNTLRKHVNRRKQVDMVQECSMLQLFEDKQVVIIADDPGMGKSTTLTKLYLLEYYADSRPKLTDTHWVINVNLKDCLRAIQGITPNSIDIPKFLSKVDKNLECNLSQSLLKLALDRVHSKNFLKPLLIVFDGFDEVMDELLRERLLKLLSFLRYKTNAKFWITSRLQHKDYLESTLSTFAITFEPLNKDKQKIFIRNFFLGRVNLLLDDKEVQELFGGIDMPEDIAKISRFTDKFLEKMKQIFRKDVSRFIGTPLQLYLLLCSKDSMEKFKEWAAGGSDSTPNFNYLGQDILEVYEKFIEGKYEIYFKKLGITQVEAIKDVYKEAFMKRCRILAQSLLLIDQSKSEKYLEVEKNKILSLSAGLIKPGIDNLEFIHPTFADYFASEIFMHWIEERTDLRNQNKDVELLTKYLAIKNSYQLTRQFLDAHLAKKLQSVPDEILKSYGEIFKKSWKPKRGSSKSNEWKYSPIHVAAQEGNSFIASFLLIGIRLACPGMISDILLSSAGRFRRTALQEAICHSHFHVVAVLIESLDDDAETLKELIMKAPNKHGFNALHYAVNANNVMILRLILNAIPAVHKATVITATEGSKPSPFHLACSLGNIDIINEFLHHARKDGEMLQNLLLSKDSEKFTALMYASKHESPAIVNMLLVSAVDDDIRSAMLMNKNNELNPFHVAVIGNDKVVGELLKAAINISTEKAVELLLSRNEHGNTALQEAVSKKRSKNSACSVIKVIIKQATSLFSREAINTLNDSNVLHRLLFDTNKRGQNVLCLMCIYDCDTNIRNTFKDLKRYPNFWRKIEIAIKNLPSRDKIRFKIETLMRAASENNISGMKTIFKNCKSPELLKSLILAYNPDSLKTALHFALEKQHFKFAEELLTHAKKVNDGWETFNELLESTNSTNQRPFDLVKGLTQSKKIISKFMQQARRGRAPSRTKTLLSNISRSLGTNSDKVVRFSTGSPALSD